jgi:DNA-binding transcriptional ArsR family regulator
VFDHQLDQIYRALASTNRRRMIARVADADVSVLELAESFPMSFSAVLQNVQLLERCGLLHTSKEGRVRTCRLEAETLRAAEVWLARTLSSNARLRRGYLRQDMAWLRGLERPEGVDR